MDEEQPRRLDPTIRGLACCLTDLEMEALSLGNRLAAALIAAANLALMQTDISRRSDRPAAGD